MKLTLKLIGILVIVSITGCYYDSEERLYPKLSSPCDDVTVTFSGTVTAILQACQSCHSNANAASSGSGIKLQDYPDVMTMVNNGKLMGSIRQEDNLYIPMPQSGGKLPDCEIAQLQKWIDNESPNN